MGVLSHSCQSGFGVGNSGNKVSVELMKSMTGITATEITYKGAHASRPADEVEVDEFVGVKSHRAKGKRLTTYEVATLRFIEPELPPEPEDLRVYDLGPLMQRNFEFTYDVGSGIESVVVKKLRLSSRATKGERIALVYALAAERLTLFYEHDQWLTEAQGASLAADWLARSKRSLPCTCSNS